MQLGSNKILDLSPIAELYGIQGLDMHSQQDGLAHLSDVRPLAVLTAIWDLDLRYNAISVISPHGYLSDMYFLNLCYIGISDLSPLAAMKDLEILHVAHNNLDDIDSLASLGALERLNLETVGIEEIDGLAGLTSLHHLILDSDKISDISPLLENLGLGATDSVWLRGNHLWDPIDAVHVMELRARGATVKW